MPITYTPSYATDFNITIGIGSENRQITLTAADLDSVATKGLHFALPAGSTVELGSLNDLISWLNARLTAVGVSVSIPTQADSGWPEPIRDIFTGVLGTTVTVLAFEIDQPPKDTDGNYPPVSFNLSVVAAAPGAGIPLIPSFFNLIGGGVALRRSVTPSTSSGS